MLRAIVLILNVLIATVTGKSEKQLACLDRDWFTLLSGKDTDITSLEIAVTNSMSDVDRILISVSNYNYR